MAMAALCAAATDRFYIEDFSISAGETRTVTFTVGPDRMQLLDASYHWVVEPGTFTLFAGPSSEDLPLSASFFVR